MFRLTNLKKQIFDAVSKKGAREMILFTLYIWYTNNTNYDTQSQTQTQWTINP